MLRTEIQRTSRSQRARWSCSHDEKFFREVLRDFGPDHEGMAGGWPEWQVQPGLEDRQFVSNRKILSV